MPKGLTFGYGHGFGVPSHNYRSQSGLELRQDIYTAIKLDMVISLDPMHLMTDGMPCAGGYREHDNPGH